jgi:hypothetical protein
VVEHCVDIAGVASSILATPTIFSCSDFQAWWQHSLQGTRDREFQAN